MKISDIKVEACSEYNTLSGICNGFELWYKFPKRIVPQVRADAFVAACLVPSMLLGSDIELDDHAPVSNKLLTNLSKLQSIFSQWSQYFGRDLKVVEVKGGTLCEVENGNENAVSFFSGGVDGTYTLLKHFDEIDLLFFSKGIDIQLSDDELFEKALQENKKFLDQKGKQIVPIESNVRFLGHKLANLGWSVCFGGGLSSIALAANVRKCFIASGANYIVLHPEGSNFITDHLWSSEHTQIVHDGAEATRIQKIEFISRDPNTLQCLRVCWQGSGYNCGICEKCLRTMASIRALGLECPTFPDLTDEMARKLLARQKIYTPIAFEYFRENYQQAQAAGDRKLARAIKKVMKNYELRNLAKLTDKVLFSGRLKKAKDRLKQR